MATNLLLSFPDIPADALELDDSTDTDPDLNIFNSIRGDRKHKYRLQSAGTAAELEYDLGVGNTAQVDHWIIARADLLQEGGVTDVALQWSNDGSAYTTLDSQSSFGSETLYNNDWISEISSGLLKRWWRARYTGSSNKFYHSKTYFGMFFDFGKDPSGIVIEKFDPTPEPFFATDGSTHFARLEDPRYRLTITWEGVSDANRHSFLEKAFDKRREGVFLYTKTNHEILNEERLLHCKIVDARAEFVYEDWNIVSAVFEQMTG